MASLLSETTVAASKTPLLRASVNAVRGPDNAPASASDRQTVKVGNATPNNIAASAIDARQRPDTEEWLDPKGESAAPKEDAPTQSLYPLKDVG